MPRWPWPIGITRLIGCCSWNQFLCLLLVQQCLISSVWTIPNCDPRMGTSLRLEDCLEAVDRLPTVSSSPFDPRPTFSHNDEDPRFRLPYSTSSRNGACNLGVDFVDPWTSQIGIRWNKIRIAALVLVSHCVSRNAHMPRWGGSHVVPGTGGVLKVMIWEEIEDEEDDAPNVGTQTAQMTQKMDTKRRRFSWLWRIGRQTFNETFG